MLGGNDVIKLSDVGTGVFFLDQHSDFSVTITGDAGDDRIFGSQGKDDIWGHAGNDKIDGGYDADNIEIHNKSAAAVDLFIDGDVPHGYNNEGDAVVTFGWFDPDQEFHKVETLTQF